MLNGRVPEGLPFPQAKLLEDGANKLSIDNRLFGVAIVRGWAKGGHGAAEPFAPSKNVEAVITGDRHQPRAHLAG
jgi:hypothetical protein